MHFHTPTPIQAEAIPIALAGNDLIGCAQTGTGKTAAFSIPIITQLLANRNEIALILVPTRELAAQVSEVIKNLTLYSPDLRSVSLIGGVPMNPQIKALKRGVRIIVATPGRLIDHLRQRTVSISNTGILVLDEADRMLDMGFAPQLNEILRFLPKSRQTLLFTATLPPETEKLAEKYLLEPKRVSIGAPSKAAPKIDQKTREVTHQQKNETLLDELNSREGTVLVFARTQSRTDRVARYLESFGVSVARIHGGRTQGQRNRALDGFRDGSFRVLVATDIAARGLDIDHVAHVINYDLPMVAEDYIHRIGRTGRNGRSGEALSLITHEDRLNWRAIQKLLGRSDREVPSSPQSPVAAGSPLHVRKRDDSRAGKKPGAKKMQWRNSNRRPQGQAPSFK